MSGPVRSPTRSPWKRRRPATTAGGGHLVLQVVVLAVVLLSGAFVGTGCSSTKAVGEVISTDPSDSVQSSGGTT